MIFYYDWISVKKGIDTETYEHRNDFINKSLSRTCDIFYKILLNTEFKPRNICIIWWNNCKYRVLTTLNHGQAQKLME